MSKRGRPPHPDILTPREWEVLDLLREELSNEEIAQRLGIGIDGVKYHVTEILSKLGLDNRHDAARWRPEEARPWWATAVAPLFFWRRLSFGWLSPALAGLLALVVVIGLSFLIWALLATRGEGGDGEPWVGPGRVLDRPSPSFVAMEFVSDDEGWLLAGGAVLHTADGGRTWDEAARLEGGGIDFADEDHGWIVGGFGAIYATTDGETWTRQRSGTEVHLSDVVAVSAQEAWAVGAGEGEVSDVPPSPPFRTALLHTTDGGATWREVETPPLTWFGEITFVGERGWVVGTACESYGEPARRPTQCSLHDAGVLLHTRDGGATWELKEIEPGDLGDVEFVDELDGWARAWSYSHYDERRSAVYRTEDGGLTWEPVDVGTARYIQALAFRDEQTGWVVVVDDPPCPCDYELLGTEDGGRTWRGQGAIESARSLHATDDALYVLGGGVALRSTDDGMSLEEMEHPALTLGDDFAFADRETGYTISDGLLLRTGDGGASWDVVGPAPDNRAVLEFLDAEHGFAASWEEVGEEGSLIVRETHDGGESWQQKLSVSGEIARVSPRTLNFADEKHGLVALSNGLYVTEDGGETWEQRWPSDETRDIVSADLVDADHIWVVAVSPSLQGDSTYDLFRSSDGGRTWQPVKEFYNPPYPTLFDFVDAERGWHAETDPETREVKVSVTEDAGRTWLQVDTGLSQIESMAYVEPARGWLLGKNCGSGGCRGELLRTSDGGRTWVEQPLDPALSQVPMAGVFIDADRGWIYRVARGVGGPVTINGRTVLYRTD